MFIHPFTTINIIYDSSMVPRPSINLIQFIIQLVSISIHIIKNFIPMFHYSLSISLFLILFERSLHRLFLFCQIHYQSSRVGLILLSILNSFLFLLQLLLYLNKSVAFCVHIIQLFINFLILCMWRLLLISICQILLCLILHFQSIILMLAILLHSLLNPRTIYICHCLFRFSFCFLSCFYLVPKMRSILVCLLLASSAIIFGLS